MSPHHHPGQQVVRGRRLTGSVATVDCVPSFVLLLVPVIVPTVPPVLMPLEVLFTLVPMLSVLVSAVVLLSPLLVAVLFVCVLLAL